MLDLRVPSLAGFLEFLGFLIFRPENGKNWPKLSIINFALELNPFVLGSKSSIGATNLGNLIHLQNSQNNIFRFG